MIAAGLWQARNRKVEDVHQWRPRRSCPGELVQWVAADMAGWKDAANAFLIAMIDEASVVPEAPGARWASTT
jgi:hypothetical protein